MKEIITNNEYLMLKGLELMAGNVRKHTEEIQTSIASIIGEEKSNYGNYEASQDWFWEESPIEKLLESCDINIR